MPIGENVLIIALLYLVRQGCTRDLGLRVVIRLLKVVFRRASQNETSLGGGSVTKPLITWVPACCLNMRHYPILRQHFYGSRLYCFNFR